MAFDLEIAGVLMPLAPDDHCYQLPLVPVWRAPSWVVEDSSSQVDQERQPYLGAAMHSSDDVMMNSSGAATSVATRSIDAVASVLLMILIPAQFSAEAESARMMKYFDLQRILKNALSTISSAAVPFVAHGAFVSAASSAAVHLAS